MFELANTIVLLSFDPANAGLVHLVDRETGIDHVQPATAPRQLWQLHLASGEDTTDLRSIDQDRKSVV